MFAVLPHLCFAAITCAVDASFGQPSAVLWKDQLFVSVSRPRDESLVLLRGAFPDRGARCRAPYEYWLKKIPAGSKLGKIEVSHDRLLATSNQTDLFIFPLTEVPLLEDSALVDKLRKTRGYPSRDRFVEDHQGDLGELVYPSHREPDVPLPKGEPGELPFQLRDRFLEQWKRIRVSVQVTGSDSLRCFHAYDGKLYVSLEPDYLWKRYIAHEGNPPKYTGRVPERELRTGALPADFTELFSAYRVESRDYLVTARGRVFMVTPRGRDRVEVSAVWDEPARRIVGVVQDANTSAVYGWGYAPARGATARFCVKLGPKPNAIPYVCDVPLGAGYADAFAESYACARAVRPSLDK